MYNNNYAIRSLELHLFFARIMKEHALFLRAGFTPVNADFSDRAEFFKNEFEKILCQATMLGDGVVSRDVLRSGEVMTEFTAMAEHQTEHHTGIAIDKGITARQMRMRWGCRNVSSQMVSQVNQINRRALELLDGLIRFKETILQNVLCCRMFTMNYPLLIEHILREARLYRNYVMMLERDGDLSGESMKETECFWNQIMMEHAMFIRGLLDPTEDQLIDTADGFAREYAGLLEACDCAQQQTMSGASLAETRRFRDFKHAGTQGITQCSIRSVILPLLADHVLREANHYIRLLEC